MEMPVNGSIELRYEITNIGAVGTVYLSGSVANPSSALYEISFQITVGVTVVRINEDILDKTLDLVDVVKRSRRDLSNVEKRPLYAAVKSSGTSSLDLKVKSSGSEERATGNSAAVAGASPIFICLTLLHTLLAMMYI
uniref:Uncharacterized protein n=1 Tax=Ciona savignyi TaxID=51511 RepID=H2YXD5_CIOSA